MYKDIKPLGVYDKDLDLFESQYKVPEGVSYNSFLILDDKVALIDTVDKRMTNQWRDNLLAALPEGKQVDYLIVQHLEPDHASQISWVMSRYPDCRLVCTAVAHRMLPLVAGKVDFDDRVMEVSDGETLNLGHHELTFVTAPMVHWPEVMMVYDSLSQTLFSADGFGRFGNPDPAEPWACEARRYYFNIVGKYGQQVQNLFKKLAGKNISTIAPLHGPVLEDNINDYIALYNTWSTYGVETQGVLVAYASIHGFTAVAAKRLGEIFRGLGVGKVALCDLTREDQAEAIEDAFRMDHLVVMSSTYDADIFPPMFDFIHHLELKGFRNRRVAIVENGLWAPASGKKMKAMFETMKDISIVEPIVTLRGRMTESDEAKLEELARNLVAE